MDSSNNYINNTIISLEENNSNKQNKSKKRKKYAPEASNESSDSFLLKIFNSVSKIGKGLKNIMSMKINIEEDNDYNSNLYDQISNRFNNQEEISLIEAPSFMDDSNSYKKYIKKKEKKMRESNKSDNDNINESNKMIISQNETKIINDINNNDFRELDSLDKSSLEKQKGIYNNSLLKNKDKKINIKSTLLAKKRDREEHSIINELIKEEEEKNEDEEEKNAKNRKHQSNEKSMIKNSESKSRIDISSNNISEVKKRNNISSITSLSIKSLDNIKNEIEERRLKNLRNIEEMHKRHGLYYDYVKERQMREKILNEYYKEKEKRIAEEKIKIELEKKKREEEFEKLKIKKSSNFKISSLKKPKKIFSEEKNTQFQFNGESENIISNQSSINASNNLNVTFGNISNNSQEDNNNKSLFNNNDGDKKETNSLFTNKENDNSKKDFKSLFGSNDNNNNKNEIKSLFDNNINDNINKENKSLFGNNISIFNDKKEENKNENENKINFNNKTKSIFNNLINKNNDNIQEKKDENKQNSPLFGGTSGSLFNGSNIVSTPAPSNSLFNSNPPKNGGSLFNLGKEDKPNSFGANNKNNESSSFFGINPNQQNNNQVSNMNKGDLFLQETTVSKSINSNSLFTSNNPENNGQNKNGSLANNDNPFLKSVIQNNQSKPKDSLFGNSGNAGSLFGTGFRNKGLFG